MQDPGAPVLGNSTGVHPRPPTCHLASPVSSAMTMPLFCPNRGTIGAAGPSALPRMRHHPPETVLRSSPTEEPSMPCHPLSGSSSSPLFRPQDFSSSSSGPSHIQSSDKSFGGTQNPAVPQHTSPPTPAPFESWPR